MLGDKVHGCDLLCYGIFVPANILLAFNMNLCYMLQNRLPEVHKLDKSQLCYQQCADELLK